MHIERKKKIFSKNVTRESKEWQKLKEADSVVIWAWYKPKRQENLDGNKNNVWEVGKEA